MTQYRRIGLTVKPHLTEKDETVAHILSILKKEKIEVFVDRPNVGELDIVKDFHEIKDTKDIDALLVIGGDGTILRSVRELNDLSIPILSVNKGAVGFLAEINIDEADDLLPQLLQGKGMIEERSILHVHVERDGKDIFACLAMNEVVISQGTISRLLDLRTSVGGELLSTFHADGLIIATPTGSTAYSLAAGGPVVHPRLAAVILTPINPHSLNQRPIVIPGTTDIETEVSKCNDSFLESTVGLTLDGQVYHELRKFDRIVTRIHGETVKFIRRKEDTFFHTLRTKLKWGERLEE
ncbi:MAG TPA: NAD(+)/NADH kinase [Candidatus Peribacteraceae bacterium]|nr:NAD(+)/NADH kinase [Candidatus Peribacteraceae bacterium]